MNLSHENSLLLYCSQNKIPAHRAAWLDELLSSSLNWEFISETAFSGNIAQLLYHSLKGLHQSHLVPPGIMDSLKNAYHGNIARNMYLYAELRTIVNAFQNARLEVIALKGAVLAGIVYRDIGLRPMMDIDLLVRKNDLPVAQKILTDLNYTAAVGSKSEQWYREKHFHLPPYRHREKPVVVEIHWHVTGNSCDIDVRKWWDRARSENLMGCSVLVPSPEDMLIHLCIHLYNHGYGNGFILRGLCDIAETLRHYENEIDWALLREQIKNHGIEKQVHSMLYLAGECYDLRESFRNVINLNKVDHRLIGILDESLLGGHINAPVNPHLLKAMLFDDFPGKARYLLPRIFLSRNEMSKRYPEASSSKMVFYYLIHPFHLMIKYGRSVVEIYRTKAAPDRRE